MPHPESRAPWSDVLRWLIVVPVSAGIGYVLDDLGIHAAWIVAGILASGAMALVSRRELPLNSAVERAARGVIGVLAGLSLVGVDYGSMLHFIVPGIVVALVTVGIGVGSGVLLSRHEREVSVETGILGMLPGGSSTLPVIARDTGADYRLVALSQYLRLLIVSLTLPVVGGLTFGSPLDLSGHATNPQLAPTLVLIAIALIGPYIGKALHFPAPHIFAPLLITPLAALAFHDPSSIVLPEPVRIVALLTIGWMCGGGLSTRSLKLFGKQLPMTIACIAFTILACAASAWALMLVTGSTYFEAYLATSPGGLETVLALASEGAVGPIVVSLQIIRLITLLIIAGYLPTIIAVMRRFGR